MKPKAAKREYAGPSSAGDSTKPLLKRPPTDRTGMHHAAGTVVADPSLHAASTSSGNGVHHPTEVDQLTEAFRALTIHDRTCETGYNEAGYDADGERKPQKRRRKRVRRRRRRKAQKTTVPSLDHEEVKKKMNDSVIRPHSSPD